MRVKILEKHPHKRHEGAPGEVVDLPNSDAEYLAQHGFAEADASAAVREIGWADERFAEALEFVISRGYSKKLAKGIVSKEGVDKILAEKASGKIDHEEEPEG